MTNRYPLIAAVALAGAAGCVWASSKLTWVRVGSADGLGEARTDAIDGSAWAAATVPLALVLVAAIAAVFAVRGWWSKLLAVAIAAVGIAAAVPGVLALFGISDAEAARIAELPGRATVTSVDAAVLPQLLAVLGGLIAIGAAVLVTLRSDGLSARYDAPAVRRTDDGSQRSMWDALDAGIDPTVSDSADSDPQ